MPSIGSERISRCSTINPTTNPTPTTTSTTTTFATTTVLQRRTLTVVVDGLDEVPVADSLQDQFLTVLDELANFKTSNIRIIVVSRDQFTIKQHLQPESGWLAVSRTAQAVESDIDLFAQHSISSIKVLQKQSDELKASIRDRLGQGSIGMQVPPPF
jgi:hypothetical protein